MKFVRLDPPGTICGHEALFEIIKKTAARTFVEVGCGAGELSVKLCRLGLSGVGIDFSAEAITMAEQNLKPYIETGQFRLLRGDIMQLKGDLPVCDLGLSMMVMEHVEDDLGFLCNVADMVRPGGYVIAGVPGRMDCWTFEDDTVGHLRRYERCDLKKLFERAGFSDVEVRSAAVPTANLLLYASDYLVRNNGNEKGKLGASAVDQTQSSGVREIPFKTVFPSFCRLILNRFTLSPLLLLQRMFYNTNLGLTMIAVGRVGGKSVRASVNEAATAGVNSD